MIEGIHFVDEGPREGPCVLFAGALGTTVSLWDRLLPHLPNGLRIIRYDLRGHGQSACPDGPYFMGDLVQDAARLLDHLGAKDVVFVGLSIGGMIAQGLAAERLDLVRGLVISNSATKIGTTQIWEDRAKIVRENGLEPLADATMERWFGRKFRETSPQIVAACRGALMAQYPQGYAGCAMAIGETDLYESTARLKLPTLGIAGTNDGSIPPDMVRETVDLVAGAQFELIRGAGHLPCVDAPEAYAASLTRFLTSIGHL
ncbi:MAG: 3-oxoadipate enol-lactonase [Maritimibacter sp.]